MRANARELEQIVDGRADLRDLRLRGATAAHRDDDEVEGLRQEPRRVAGDRGLPHPLPGPDHRERRKRERLVVRRPKREVSALVGDPVSEDPAREAEPLLRPEHGLVREVDRDPRLEARERLVERVDDGDAVVVVAAQLLGPADQERPDDVIRELLERVPDHGRIVLAVDQRERPHSRVVTSCSIRPVYFSNARLSRENWMIRSWPWNGYLRQTSTWVPETSTML